MHIGSLYKFPAGLRVIPVVGSRKEPVNLEVQLQAPPKIIESLHVAVRPVYIPVAMAEAGAGSVIHIVALRSS